MLATVGCTTAATLDARGRGYGIGPAIDLDDLERRTFDWFWDLSDIPLGLTPDRWPTESFSSIAATGFAISSYCYGVERGWIGRAEGAERVQRVLRFLANAPQGPEASGTAGFRGFFYHFLDMESGKRFDKCELSSIDTALLMAGALSAEKFFIADEHVEQEIRRLARELVDRVEWDWMLSEGPYVSMGWHPESGFISSQWDAYNECMILYMLAIGSRTHPIDPEVWSRVTSNFASSWGRHWGEEYLHFAPLFGHQYSHVWIDFRGIRDPLIDRFGIDYFENSRRATRAQRNYAIANPGGFKGYSGEIWGLTACDGPGDFKTKQLGRKREFFSYSARGPGYRDDGTIAPTAAGGSLAFEPELAAMALAAMKRVYGAKLYGRYGFRDSFNPTLVDASGLPLLHGHIEPGLGWIDGDYLGIDQGPILLMAGNLRSEFLWRLMRGSDDLFRGLRRAGFTGGWLG